LCAFLNIYISQGSVATQLRCGGIFSNHSNTVDDRYLLPLRILCRSVWLSVILRKCNETPTLRELVSRYYRCF